MAALAVLLSACGNDSSSTTKERGERLGENGSERTLRVYGSPFDENPRPCEADVKVAGSYEEEWSDGGLSMGSDAENTPDRIYVSVSPEGSIIEVATNSEGGTTYALTLRGGDAGGWLGDPQPQAQDFERFELDGSGVNLQAYPAVDPSTDGMTSSNPIQVSATFECE